MRTTSINTLYEFAKKDERIIFLTGDLGFSVLERFKEDFPNRFYNVGIAESNMIGLAAGLAHSGKIVFVYSIMPFVTARCYEQIKIDVCYHNLNIKIVGVGGGVSYGSQGATHHANEDIAIMRALPNMKVICPSDQYEAKESIKMAIEQKGPVFIRLERNNEPKLYSDRNDFSLGKGYVAQEGKDISIISCGTMVGVALKAAKILNDYDISTKVISMYSVKPIDKDIVLKCMKDTKAIFTIEEHNIIGGLGSAVAEIIAESNCAITFERFGINDKFIDIVGTQDYIRQELEINPEDISNKILKQLKNMG